MSGEGGSPTRVLYVDSSDRAAEVAGGILPSANDVVVDVAADGSAVADRLDGTVDRLVCQYALADGGVVDVLDRAADLRSTPPAVVLADSITEQIVLETTEYDVEVYMPTGGAVAVERLNVSDDGEGIPPDARDAVFDHGHTGDAGGTCVGLSIVRAIVEAHGWSVGVTESEDGGARFEISFDDPTPSTTP